MIGSVQVHPLVPNRVRRQRGYHPIHIARERERITQRYKPDARTLFDRLTRERLGVAPTSVFDEAL